MPLREHFRRRHGQSLVEFAVVALVTYMLLAAILTFGFLFYAAQGSQSAADVAAREFSRVPLPADSVTLNQVLYGNPAEISSISGDPNAIAAIKQARKQVFNEHYLVLFESDVLDEVNGGYDQNAIQQLPVVNQQLLPLMIFDVINGDRVFRYPGAICSDTDSSDDPDPLDVIRLTTYLIAVPLVSSDQQSITWVRPLEPIVAGVGSGETGSADPFRISSGQLGIVGLRLNYPVQSTVMTAHTPNPAGPFEPTVGTPIESTDSYSEGSLPPGMSLLGGRTLVDDHGTPDTSDDTYTGPYGGNYGLGVHGAMGQAVRPFPRVISAQAIYRREIFQ